MWGDHLGQILTARHRIELTARNTFLVHIAPYRPGLESRKCAATAINRALKQDVIDPMTTEWAYSIVVSSKRDD